MNGGNPMQKEIVATDRNAILWAEAEVGRLVAQAKRDRVTLEPLETLFHNALVEYTKAQQDAREIRLKPAAWIGSK
jgi:hypothetical protein